MESHPDIATQSFAPTWSPLTAPLPFFPALGKLLSGVTLSILVCYLEIHHPAPASDFQSFTGQRNPPIMLDCDIAAAELGVSRRTLHLALCSLGAWYRTEGERERSSRAGREFLNPVHTQHGKIKMYSMTGSKAWHTARTIAIRRNIPQILRIFSSAGLSVSSTSSTFEFPEIDQTSAIEQVAHSLPSILESVCGIGGDRRSTRWERWRKGREIREKS